MAGITRRGTTRYGSPSPAHGRQARHQRKPQGWRLVAELPTDNPLLVPGLVLVLSQCELTVIRKSVDLRETYAGCTFENKDGERMTL